MKPFARDPHYPRQSSMMDLMGREGSYPVHLIEEPEHLNKEGFISIEHMSQVVNWANQVADLPYGRGRFLRSLAQGKGSKPESCSANSPNE